MRKVVQIIIILFLINPILCLGGEFYPVLNGFYLWQFKAGVRNHFGEPFETQDFGDRIIEAYKVTDTSYMAFEFLKEKFEHNAFSVQISGYPTHMTAFRGVKLGDSFSDVEKKLGKAESSKKVEGLPYTIYYYNDDSNFSTEFDEDNRLYSIRIYVTDEFMNDAEHDFDSWTDFTEAIKAKDMKRISDLLRPDFEIFKDDKVLSVETPFAEFLANPDNEIVNAFIGENGSVKAAMEESEPDGEARLIIDMGLGQVYKFYKGSVVAEIVLFPYNGKYRIYEVTFCSKTPYWEKQPDQKG